MVNQEILRIIEQISREKGIEKEVLLAGVEAAVLSAAKRRYGPAESLQAHFNHQSGMLELTIGDERPKGTGVFQERFLAAPNSAGTPIVSETPDPLGPRKRSQSSSLREAPSSVRRRR